MYLPMALRETQRRLTAQSFLRIDERMPILSSNDIKRIEQLSDLIRPEAADGPCPKFFVLAQSA